MNPYLSDIIEESSGESYINHSSSGLTNPPSTKLTAKSLTEHVIVKAQSERELQTAASNGLIGVHNPTNKSLSGNQHFSDAISFSSHSRWT